MRIATCSALAFGLLCVACGGGGGGGDGPATYTLDARLYESASGTVSNAGEVRHDIWSAGDLADNTTRRAFYTWILDDLPPDAEIQRAVFTTQWYLKVGDPFTHLGDVVVDHVDAGLTLDAPDYGASQFTLDIGTICVGDDYGLHSLDVTEAVREDRRVGRGITTLRLRHRSQTNVDDEPDFTGYSPSDWTEDHRRASLVIEYTLP